MEQYALALETAINAFFSFEIYQQKNKKTDSFSFNLNETKNNYFWAINLALSRIETKPFN